MSAEIFSKIKSQLNARGVKNIRGLCKSFKTFDVNGERRVEV